MNRADTVAPARIAVPRAASIAIALPRVAFLDHIRYLMVLLVVVYHAVAAYARVAPHWAIHDTSFAAADTIRELLDVFMMPVLFFVAGYFALPSLEKKGAWEFLKDKGKRLLVPWALLVLVLAPLALYDRPEQVVRPFRSYWLWYLGNFRTGLSFLTQSQTTQLVYWFLTLLFAFFVLFALAHAVMRRWRSGAALPAVQKAARGNPALVTLLLFGVMTSAGYFASLLLFPDTSWFTLGAFLQFQPARLVLFAGYFALGVYAQSHGWFADGKPLGSLALWGAISVALAVAHLVIGRPLFADPAATPHLPVMLLLGTAFIRSFLVLAVLVVLASAGIRYWNRSRGFDRQLSQTSYDIYLTHFWFVVVAQGGLMDWTGGPAPLKFAIATLTALPLSFAFSRWVIGRHSRALAAGLLALLVFCLAIRP